MENAKEFQVGDLCVVIKNGYSYYCMLWSNMQYRDADAHVIRFAVPGETCIILNKNIDHDWIFCSFCDCVSYIRAAELLQI
jgi:aerobic-type carbon monoxide dehydrogenase small subunit (CoxS/CutS family)